MGNNIYYIYIMRCEDNSLYTGITTDLHRRFKEHKDKLSEGAKYTKSHQVISIERVWVSKTRSDASKLEYHIKKLKKHEKEQLVKANCPLSIFFEFDCSKFLDV